MKLAEIRSRLLSESKGIILPQYVKQQAESIIKELCQYILKAKESGKPIYNSELIINLKNHKDSGSARIPSTPFFGTNIETDYIRIFIENNQNGELAWYEQYGPQWEIYINAAKIDQISEIEIYRILTHELIHIFDPRVAKGIAKSSSSKDVGYYQNYGEFDAYTSTIVNTIYNIPNKLDKQKALKLLNDTLEFLKNPIQAANNGIYGIFSSHDYYHLYIIYCINDTKFKTKFYQRIIHAISEVKNNYNS